MRSRASTTIKESLDCFSACAAPRPAAPAPMIATSTSEGRDIRSPATGCPAFAGHDRVSLSHRLLGLFRALAVVGVEVALAQADRFRRDLDQLVVLDIG